MRKKLNINLFRVSPDSKFLDMLFDCSIDSYFTSLQIEVRYFNKGILNKKIVDLGELIFNNDPEDEETTVFKHQWVLRIPLNKIFKSENIQPAIYIAYFKVGRIIEIGDEEYELDFWDDTEMSSASAAASDVNSIYKVLLDGVIGSNKCEITDDVIRNYLILYAHQMAMDLRELDDATMYFKLITNNFNNCGGKFKRNEPNNYCSCIK